MAIRKILILGFSDIVQRRVLPAFATIGGLQISIASRSRFDRISGPHGLSLTRYSEYETAVRLAQPDLVYISTINSEHGKWAALALERGCHVIVDKPAFTCFDEAAHFVDLARRQQVCISESAVFAFHPQIQMLKELFTSESSRPSCLTAQFSFPALPLANYRYSRAMGGGALRDLSSYAVVTGRLFVGAPIKEVFCQITSQSTEVDESFSVALIYEDGCSLIGHFGFRTGYVNRLELLGPGLTVAVDRIFTTPPDLENSLQVRRQGIFASLVCPAADSFVVFLLKVLEAIEIGTYDNFAELLLADACGMDLMRSAARL